MPITHMALNLQNQRHKRQPLSPSEDHVQEKCLFQLSSRGWRQSTSTTDHGKQGGPLSLETSTWRRKYAAGKTTAPAHRGSDTQGPERRPAPVTRHWAVYAPPPLKNLRKLQGIFRSWGFQERVNKESDNVDFFFSFQVSPSLLADK